MRTEVSARPDSRLLERIKDRLPGKYGRELDTAPDLLPSGWAAVLYLYGLR